MMMDNDDDFQWDGYDHLMSTKPTNRNDPKASIFDLNNMRDSVLFEKERFSFCLSPPKEKGGSALAATPKVNTVPSATTTTANLKIQQQQQQQQAKENIPNNLNVRIINTNTKQAQPVMGTTQPIKIKPSSASPPLVSQQHKQPLSPKTNSSSLSRVPSSPNIKTQPFNHSKSSSNSIPLNNNVNLSSSVIHKQQQQQQQPTIPSKKEQLQSLTDVQLEPMNLTRQQQQSSMSNRPPTPTQSSTASRSGMSNRPGTPTQIPTVPPILSSQNTITVIPLSTRPATPTKGLTSTNVPPIQPPPLAVIEQQQQQQGMSAVTEAKFESRIKILEAENRLLKSQMVDKDKSIDQLSSRINELESQMHTFMDEVKLFLMSNMDNQDN